MFQIHLAYPTQAPGVRVPDGSHRRVGPVSAFIGGPPATQVELALVSLFPLLAAAARSADADQRPSTHDHSSTHGHPSSPAPRWPEPHPMTALLTDMAPGPELAAILTNLDSAHADPDTLVEAIAAWERLSSWTAAGQAQAISQLYRRREAQHCESFVGDEVATCLGTTRHAGDGKVGRAISLERLPAVADALQRGLIDVRKADLLADELLSLGDSTAQAMAAELLPDAPRLTVPQLRSRIRRAELARNPQAAHERHQKARAQRRVELHPARDAMGWLNAYLPADEATAVYTTLSALADAAAPEDERGVDARRADALADVITGFLDTGQCPDGRPLPRRQGRYPHLNVTASATTVLGLDDMPGELSGFGPIPGSMVRDIASRSVWRPLLVDDESGELRAGGSGTYRPNAGLREAVVTRDVTCVFPGCRVPAFRCDLDHITPFDPDLPAEDQTTDVNLQPLCRHHHLAKTHGGWQVVRDAARGVTTWRSPAGQVSIREPAQPNPPPPRRVADDEPGPSPPDRAPDPEPDHELPPF